MSDSSSESDSEEMARLKAAAVSGSTIQQKAKTKPRAAEGDEEERKYYELEPECQKFIARKLDEILEKSYKLKKRKQCDEEEEETDVGGIRLFSHSKKVLKKVPKMKTPTPVVQTRPKKKKEKISDSMLAMCAVTPEWVLNNPVKRASEATKST